MKLVAAVDRDEIDALEDLKATNQIITSSLQNDLVLLQGKFKNLTTDYDQQKSHLVDALLAKDKLRQELATLREGKDAAGEENNAGLQALKEVSYEIDSSQEISSSLHLPPALSRSVSFYPCIHQPKPPQNAQPVDEAAMLALERQAIGAMEPSKAENVDIAAPNFPISPMPSVPPANLRSRRGRIFRRAKWTDDGLDVQATIADDIHSKPKSKNWLSKISNSSSKWLRKLA